MDQLIALIASAAEKLGYETVRIWPQIVLVTFVRSLGYLVLDGFGLIVAIIGLCVVWRIAMRRYAEANDRVEAANAKEGRDPWSYSRSAPDLSDYVMSATLFSLPFMAMGVIAALTAPYYLSAVLYPEAVTVMNLVQQARP